MNQKKQSTQQTKNLNRVIKIDEAQIHSHLDEMVRDTVEETINKMLDAEADRLCNAQRYEHTDSRTDTRAGSYRRKLQTKAGTVSLKVPRLRKATFLLLRPARRVRQRRHIGDDPADDRCRVGPTG